VKYVITLISTFILTVTAAVTLVACEREKAPGAASVSDKPAVKSDKKDVTKVAQADPVSSTPLVTVDDKFDIVKKQVECEKPTVIEFFAYHCNHCYKMHPEVIKWREKNKGKVDFIMIPTHLGQEKLSQLLLVHHAAKAAGVLEKTQDALFEQVHKIKKLFGSEDEVVDFLVAQGADKEQARKALTDEATLVDAINADFELLKAYKVTAVPRILVNHRYMTTIGKAGGVDQIFDVVDELLKKDHECHPKK
jgi:thiol:disulfide interchange protein DsbA